MEAEVNMDSFRVWHNTDFPPVNVPSRHPLFVILAAGDSDKPKQVIHSHAGFLLHSATTYKVCFTTLNCFHEIMFTFYSMSLIVELVINLLLLQTWVIH